jgi:PTH2 family peptidyl-tRNA hydrolase
MKEPKQIILMRTDLNMSRGKMCAQAAHASARAIFEWQNQKQATRNVYMVWKYGSAAKICLQVGSEQELLELVEKATQAGIINALICDEGRTEFEGIPTLTCAAIGPANPDDINAITGQLKLL